MKIERIPVGKLTEWHRNVKRHKAGKVAQLCQSMREFGFTKPVVVDEGYRILAGHARVRAAIKEGVEEIPAVVVRGWNPETKEAFLIADNQLAEESGWDADLLKEELSGLLKEWDRADIADLLGFDGKTADEWIGVSDRESIKVEADQSRPSKISAKCIVGSCTVPCTQEEVQMAIELAEEYKTRRGDMVGFVAWLSGGL